MSYVAGNGLAWEPGKIDLFVHPSTQKERAEHRKKVKEATRQAKRSEMNTVSDEVRELILNMYG